MAKVDEKYATELISRTIDELLANKELQKAILANLKEILQHATVREMLFTKDIDLLKKEMEDEVSEHKETVKTLTDDIEKKRELERISEQLEGLVSAKVLARLKGNKV